MHNRFAGVVHVKANDIRNGVAITIDGNVWVVVKNEHVKPGKGPAFVQVKLKNVTTGGHIEKRLRTSEEVDATDLDRRDIEYLYSDSTGAVFMDNQTYDQLIVSADLLGNALDFVKPNTSITGLFHNGNVISIDLPASVDLEVTDTPPGIKDATKTNQLKEATCETGLKTKVPPFIKIGEKVRVSTETGEYLSRVSGE